MSVILININKRYTCYSFSRNIFMHQVKEDIEMLYLINGKNLIKQTICSVIVHQWKSSILIPIHHYNRMPMKT